MKAIITGKIPSSRQLRTAVDSILDYYMQKLAEDSPEAAASLEENSEGVFITEVAVTFGFKLKGQEGLQLLTVDPLGAEHPELLVVRAETDEHGNLMFDSMTDNEHESEFSTVEALIAEGLPDEFQEVESNYYSDQLFEEDSFIVSNMVVGLFTTLDNQKIVVQYSQDNKLINEVEIETEEGVLDKLREHFEQLI